jgi:hypothetical protein
VTGPRTRGKYTSPGRTARGASPPTRASWTPTDPPAAPTCLRELKRDHGGTITIFCSHDTQEFMAFQCKGLGAHVSVPRRAIDLLGAAEGAFCSRRRVGGDEAAGPRQIAILPCLGTLPG